MGALNPTAIKRWIALEARRLREEAGLDRAAAAARIGKASTVIAHIETARNLPAHADLEILLNLYGVPDRVAFFQDLIKRAKRGKDWWIKFSDAVPDWFNLYLGLETGAARISTVDLNAVNGLFQTADYANAILRPPESRLTDEQAEKKLQLRLARQAAVLDRQDDVVQLWAVVDEGVLHRQVGSPAIMQKQLEHLIELSHRPNIMIQVLPFSAGAHPATDGAFMILDYPAEFGSDPGTVFVENRREAQYYETPAEVRDFRDTFERIQLQADRPAPSREIIKKIAKEMK